MLGTQPAVTRAGVSYYLTGAYERTGTTYADRDKAFNRIPIIYLRDGRDALVLSGHHRCTAALLLGCPVLARVIEGPWGGAAMTVYITPLLLLGAGSLPLPVREVNTADDAVAAIEAGERIRMPEDAWDLGTEVLQRLGSDEETVADRIHFARTGRTTAAR